MALFAVYVRAPSSKDFKVYDICGRLSADLITGKEAARGLKLEKKKKKKIDGLEEEKANISNHSYHAKY